MSFSFYFIESVLYLFLFPLSSIDFNKRTNNISIKDEIEKKFKVYKEIKTKTIQSKARGLNQIPRQNKMKTLDFLIGKHTFQFKERGKKKIAKAKPPTGPPHASPHLDVNIMIFLTSP